MVIGSYCYLDGEMFIKIVSTMDAVCRTVAANRSSPTGYAYLATPTDCHLVTDDAVRAASRQSHGGLASLFSLLCKSGYNKRNMLNGMQFTNSVVSRQGPNYVLAKRMQTWRAMLAQSQNAPVSLNVAPTTTTVSVMKNAVFAFTMAGMPSFKPMEPFATETTKSVMTALLVHDMIKGGKPRMDHPLQLLQTQQVHGGMYRTGLLFDSMGIPAFLMAVLKKYWFVFVFILAVIMYVLMK